MRNIFIVLSSLLFAALAGCTDEKTINNYPAEQVQSVPTPQGECIAVLETIDIPAGLALQGWNDGSVGSRAQQLRLRMTGCDPSALSAITFCVINDINTDGSAGTSWSEVSGVPAYFDEFVDQYAGGPVEVGAFVRDATYSVTEYVTAALSDGAATIRIDGTQFAGLDELFIELNQQVPAGAPFLAIRLAPDTRGACGATGAVIEGAFNQSVVQFLPSDVSTFRPANVGALTDSQVDSVVSLLRSFGADEQTIQDTQAVLTGNATALPNPPPPPPCVGADCKG